MTYQDRKDQVRQEAIDWQTSFQDKSYSYSELMEYSEYFNKLGKRYGLLREFKENGIC